jgi:flagellar basal body-associated protein FliL
MGVTSSFLASGTWESDEQQAGSNLAGSTLAIIGIVVGLLVLLTAGLLFYVFSKRVSESSPSSGIVEETSGLITSTESFEEYELVINALNPLAASSDEGLAATQAFQGDSK